MHVMEVVEHFTQLVLSRVETMEGEVIVVMVVMVVVMLG